MHHWRLDETTGATAADSVAGGDDGAVTGAAWTAQGRVGGALSFDGNDFVQVGADALAAGDGWTAALWVKRTAATASSALFAPASQTSGNAALKLEQYNNTQKVGVTRFKVANDVFDYSTPLDTWTHLAFVGTASETKLYADGVHQGTLDFGMALPLHRIGGYAVGGALGFDNINAVLDDIRIYAKALTAAEVAQLHDAAPAAPAANTAASFDGGAVRGAPRRGGRRGGRQCGVRCWR